MKAKKSLTKVTDDTDNDSSNPPLLLSKRIREKIAAVRWRAFITTTIIFLGYFLLNASISLIGVFYPAEVRTLNQYILYIYQFGPIRFQH